MRITKLTVQSLYTIPMSQDKEIVTNDENQGTEQPQAGAEKPTPAAEQPETPSAEEKE